VLNNILSTTEISNCRVTVLVVIVSRETFVQTFPLSRHLNLAANLARWKLNAMDVDVQPALGRVRFESAQNVWTRRNDSFHRAGRAWAGETAGTEVGAQRHENWTIHARSTDVDVRLGDRRSDAGVGENTRPLRVLQRRDVGTCGRRVVRRYFLSRFEYSAGSKVGRRLARNMERCK